MISAEMTCEIEWLLDLGGYSHRQICARLGVSRNAVRRVARRRAALRAPTDGIRYPALPAEGEPPPPVVRCPTCGGRVVMPCLLCQVRAMKSAERRCRRPRAPSACSRRGGAQAEGQ